MKTNRFCYLLILIIYFVNSIHHIGMNKTKDPFIKNASHYIREEPPNPKMNVSPW